MFLYYSFFSNLYLWFTKHYPRVICYHRVNNYNDYFGIKVADFEKQIKYLKRKFNIISLSDFVDILNKKNKIDNALLITFDDGYADNYYNAFPILKKYSAPAVFFLATDFIDREMWIWHDIYRYIVENTRHTKVDLIINSTPFKFCFNNLSARMKSRRIIVDFAFMLNRKDRMAFLKKIADKLNVVVPDLPTKKYASMNWNQVKELSSNGISFGAHTCKHEILSKINNDDVRTEIAQSKKRIEKEIQKEVYSFAYPNGMSNDFTLENIQILKETGFLLAFTMIRGVITSNNRYTLRRFPNPKEFDKSFLANISGIYDLKKEISRILTKRYYVLGNRTCPELKRVL